MTKLSCTARDCVNNEGGLCGAENIMIEGVNSTTSIETYCSNYKKETVTSQIAALGNTNYVGEVMQMISSMDEMVMSPEVFCHAQKCFYNGNGKCEARNIMILSEEDGSLNGARCETFVE